MKLAVCCSLLVAVATAHAEPTAVEHYETGKRWFAKGDFEKAAAQFAAARALDPQPKYVFNLAQAQRLAGHCKEALAAYRDFLASNPPEGPAAIARTGVEKCAAAEPDAAPKPPDPVATVTPPSGGEPSSTIDQSSRANPPVRETQSSVPTPTIIRERAPWYRDTFGDVLTGAGCVLVVASGVFYLQARDAASDTHGGGTLDAFEQARDHALERRGLSAISGGIGIALVAGGIIRYALRPSHERIVVAPSAQRDTIGLAIEGRF